MAKPQIRFHFKPVNFYLKMNCLHTCNLKCSFVKTTWKPCSNYSQPHMTSL